MKYAILYPKVQNQDAQTSLVFKSTFACAISEQECAYYSNALN